MLCSGKCVVNTYADDVGSVCETLISLAHYFVFIYRNKLQLLRMRFVPQASIPIHTQYSHSVHIGTPTKGQFFILLHRLGVKVASKPFEIPEVFASRAKNYLRGIAVGLVICCVGAATRAFAPSIAS